MISNSLTRKHRICLCRGNQDHFLVIEDARYSGKTVAGQRKTVVVVQRSEAKHYAVFIAVFTDIAAYVHFEIKVILLRRRCAGEEKGIGLPDS